MPLIPRSPVSPYSPSSLPTDPQAARAAAAFAELVGRVVNATVSPSPIKFVEREAHEFRGYVGYCPHKFPVPMRLQNGQYLYVYQELGLRRPERFLTTLEYRYVYQQTEENDSWLFRYEYQREPPEAYPYPRAHLHVNARPGGYSKRAKEFPRLHLPTARVTVESVVRHLLDEHAVPAISPTWQETLREAEGAFKLIQNQRVLTPASN